MHQSRSAKFIRLLTPFLQTRWAILVLALLDIYLITSLPISAIANAVNDDRLFVYLARQIAGLRWLGPFNQNTLVKGPIYPIFIASAFWLGIPLRLAQTIIYLLVSFWISELVKRQTGSKWLRLAIFAALSLDPTQWSEALSRVIREGLYVSLSLATVAATFSLATSPVALSRLRAIVPGIACGAIWAAFWMTREEGVWLVPSVLLIAFSGIILRRADHKVFSFLGLKCKQYTLQLAFAIVTTLVLISSTSMLNKVKYGSFEVVEVNSYAFRHAYGAISRVKPNEWRRYVVFPRDVRHRVYSISPASLELAPFFEGRPGEDWRKLGCAQTRQTDCPEILSGWFQWALRDAVTSAGHYKNAAEAQSYYERLAREIDRACDVGRLQCFAQRASLAPPFRIEYLKDMIPSIGLLGREIWSFGAGEVGVPVSIGTEQEMNYFSETVGRIRRPIRKGDSESIDIRRDMIFWKICKLIASLYMTIFAAITVLLTFGSAFLFAWRKFKVDLAIIDIFISACLLAVLSRIVLLAYIDVTGIPSANSLYASPASPFLVCCLVCQAWTLISAALHNRVQTRTIELVPALPNRQ